MPSYVIVGCGRVGAELAYRLFKRGHDVTVVDQRPAMFLNLPPDFRGRVLEGDALDHALVPRIGYDEAQGLAAVTNSDTANAVIGYAARTIFRVPQVVVRNYDPRWRPLHEAFGLQAVGSSSWGAQRMEELLYDPRAHSVFSAGHGEVEIYEILIPEALAGKPLRVLLDACECGAVALTRAGVASLPSPDAILGLGDVVHVTATDRGIQELREKLTAADERHGSAPRGGLPCSY